MPDENTDAPNEKKKGRPGFVPSDDQRARVSALLLAGALKEDIAAALGISLPTLRDKFAAEIEAAKPDPGPDLFASTGNDLPTAQAAPKPSARKPGGRPRYLPTDRNRDDVTTWAAAGVRVAIMARMLKISVPTLTKVFAVELSEGLEIEQAKNAVLLREAAEDGNVSAMKARAEMLERRALDAAAQTFTHARGNEIAPPAKPGKKEQARLDAAAVVQTTDGWGQVMAEAATASQKH